MEALQRGCTAARCMRQTVLGVFALFLGGGAIHSINAMQETTRAMFGFILKASSRHNCTNEATCKTSVGFCCKGSYCGNLLLPGTLALCEHMTLYVGIAVQCDGTVMLVMFHMQCKHVLNEQPTDHTLSKSMASRQT